MQNTQEEIIQVLSLFRHGKRNTLMNLETCQSCSADLFADTLAITTNKGRKFIEKYFHKFSPFPFNPKDFKCIISETIRTIKTIIYRLVDLLPKADFKSMKEEELKEFTLKNIPNAIYDGKIFKSHAYCFDISSKYCYANPHYKQIFEEVEEEISKKSKKSLEIYKKYLESPMFKGKKDEYFKLNYIYDFLFYISDDVQQKFNEEQLIIKDVFDKLNVNKRMLEVHFENKNVNLCFSHQLICNYYQEMDKVRKNSEDKKKIVLFSGHDIYLITLLNFLGFEDKTKFNYYFDDEINFIIFKKENEEKFYFRAEYNDDVLELPFSTLENKKECELNTVMEKIEKEYLTHTFEEIMDFCLLKSDKEFYPSK